MRPQDDGHSWYSIRCPDSKTTWLFDVTFLLSDFSCIYGRGCPSIDTAPDPQGVLGCCTHGAHMVDKQDRRDVTAHADLLTDDEWQFGRRARAKGGPLKRKKSGEWVTRMVEGACIFLNRAGFPGGPGCALHRAALGHGQRPMDWKPDVCWQVPIRLDVHQDDYGHETVLIRAWERRDWGPGGEDFHWWCMEDDKAFVGQQPMYQACRDELVEMVGLEVYQRLCAELDARGIETDVVLSPSVRTG